MCTQLELARYQIFISSTYEDLKNERDEVIKTILRMGHIPVGMEMFNAGNATQWEIIKRTIERCDYYIIIFGLRYGSISGETGISCTEMEYNYATELKIPVLAMVVNKEVKFPDNVPGSWKVDYYSNTDERMKFYEKVTSRMSSFWSTADELAKNCSISLSDIFNIEPRTGLIPANEALTPEITNQISQLLSDNKSLEAKLRELENELAQYKDISNIVSSIVGRDVLKNIRFHYRLTSDEYYFAGTQLISIPIDPSQLLRGIINEYILSGDFSYRIAADLINKIVSPKELNRLISYSDLDGYNAYRKGGLIGDNSLQDEPVDGNLTVLLESNGPNHDDVKQVFDILVLENVLEIKSVITKHPDFGDGLSEYLIATTLGRKILKSLL